VSICNVCSNHFESPSKVSYMRHLYFTSKLCQRQALLAKIKENPTLPNAKRRIPPPSARVQPITVNLKLLHIILTPSINSPHPSRILPLVHRLAHLNSTIYILFFIYRRKIHFNVELCIHVHIYAPRISHIYRLLPNIMRAVEGGIFLNIIIVMPNSHVKSN